MRTHPPFRVTLKASPNDILLPAFRGLLFLSCLLILLTGSGSHWFQYYLPAFMLLSAGLLLRMLVQDLKIPVLLIAVLAGLIILLSTGKLVAPVILTGMLVLLKSVYRQPTVLLEEKGVQIRQTLRSRLYDWSLFSNVLMKDQLLTLDFKNNQLIQLEIEGDFPDETAFNHYCAGKTAAP